MITLVSDHYKKLLGPIYSWMVGDLEAATERADAELAAIGLPTSATGYAVDLGAGFGLHSVPLARRGYKVVAIDNYEPLLQELKSRAGSLAVRTVLAPGGLFAASFRDYVSTPLQGDGRFILVRGDERRLLTCFLEYSDTTVRVYDLLHERVANNWQLRLSSYPKLRLAPEWIVKALTSRGFSVRREAGLSGMVRVVARL